MNVRGGSGRFGKYGDLKRKSKIRKNLLVHAGCTRGILAAPPARKPDHRKERSEKK